MRLNRRFRERGQSALIIAALILFVCSHLADEKAAAVMDVLFALCIFGIILLEIICRKRRPGQRLWTRRARLVIFFAGLYCAVFGVHCALVLMGIALPGFVKLVMSLLGFGSIAALVLHDSNFPRRRTKK